MKQEYIFQVEFDFITTENENEHFSGILASTHENKLRNYLEKKIKATNISIGDKQEPASYRKQQKARSK